MLNPLLSGSDSASHFASDRCDLCGLPLRRDNITAAFSERSYSFCCLGCRQIFSILLESNDHADPNCFKESELFRQCREKGILPGSETDLESRAFAVEPQNSSPTATARLDGTFAGSSKNILQNVHLKVGNMWCPACAWLIEEILKKTAGVIDASCNFFTDRIHIHFNPIQTSPAQIIRTISKLGYNAAAPEAFRDDDQGRKELLRFAISAVLTLNIMMMSYALYSGFFTELAQNTVYKLSLPAFMMATIVLIYGGFNFFKKAWAGLIHGAFSMETLIIIGSLSAYLYSSINLFEGSIHLYYDTASMLITLVLLGKTLERRAKSRIIEGMEHFFALKPTKVRICSDRFPQGRYVAIERLGKGDLFYVKDNELKDTDSLKKNRLWNDQYKHSLVFLGVDGKLCAAFTFGDRLREKILPTIQKLKERGYRLVLVSGDGIPITRAIGNKIKIKESYGAKLPQEKAVFVRELQKQGIQVAMVGDGINDAPAMVAADFSIAVHTGGQIGKETADISIMRSDPTQILDFLNMAEKVNKKIHHNLIYAFIYNTLGIPIAMSGFLNPLVAVCAMLFSSLSIIGNTFLLIKKIS